MNPSRTIRADNPEQGAGVVQGFDPTNVVPFARTRRAGTSARAAPAIAVSAADRLGGALATSRARWVALILCSAAAHAGLYLPLVREPEPMASLGEMVISAEIIVGTNTPAGPADERGQAEASAPEPAKTPEPPIDRPTPEFAQAAAVKPEVAQAEPPPQARPLETEPQPVAPLPEPPELAVNRQASDQPGEEQPRIPAEIAAAPQTVAPAELQASLAPQASDETAPVVPEARVVPPQKPPTQPHRSPAVAKPQPKQPEKPKPEARRASLTGAPNDRRSTAPAASSAGGVGRGRSEASSNYAGLVAAHLARFKQFPSDARSRGDQGRAAVTFSLSGNGGVTSVRLARGTGVASLDAEATAMVRRASPFPPPPNGRPISFTVPVSFRLN